MPNHEHCEAVIASLERQLAWYREERVLLEAENAHMKLVLQDLGAYGPNNLQEPL